MNYAEIMAAKLRNRPRPADPMAESIHTVRQDSAPKAKNL